MGKEGKGRGGFMVVRGSLWWNLRSWGVVLKCGRNWGKFGGKLSATEWIFWSKIDHVGGAKRRWNFDHFDSIGAGVEGHCVVVKFEHILCRILNNVRSSWGAV